MRCRVSRSSSPAPPVCPSANPAALTAPRPSARPGRRTSAVAFPGAEPEDDDPLLAFAPFIHPVPRRNSITPARQRAFIAALAASGIVTQAARKIGASLEALYKLRHRTGAEGFAAAWEAAIDRGMARLEDCALERAIMGEERPVVWDGQVVATWRRYDTALLMFLLRQRRGRRYGAINTIQPGDPAYEKLKAMWIAEEAMSMEEVRASLDAKLARLREVVLGGPGGGEADGASGEAGGDGSA
jgi:hypothetical protein